MKISSPLLIQFLILFLFSFCSEKENNSSSKETIEEILENLNQIETAHYTSTIASFNVYDTDHPVYESNHYFKEYINPLDTFVGASFVRLKYEDSTKMEFSYDGIMRSRAIWERGFMEVDSFKIMKLPYRDVRTPFYTRAKVIFNYIMETKDSISYVINNYEDSFKISLTIHDTVNTVDFIIGTKPMYETQRPEYYDIGFSKYDIWINKRDNLPYKIKRDLPHNISVETIRKVEINNDNISNFSAKSYFPDLPFLDKSKKQEVSNLIGAKAPIWALKDSENEIVSLDDFKGKVILLEFTGIGCGPCHAALPFLKQLAMEYDENIFEIVSIESWGSNPETIKRYQDKYELNFKILRSNELVENHYQVDGVPQFYLIDPNQTINAKFSGYSQSRENEDEIKNSIKRLIEISI